ADLDQKRKPGLQPNAQPAHLLMNQIKVKVDAFTPVQFQLQLLGLVIAPRKPGPAGLDTTDCRHQPRTHTLALFDLQGNLLLVCPAGRQIDHRAVVFFSQSSTGLTNTIGKGDSEPFKVLPEHTHPLEIVLHDRGMVEAPERALESESIPAVQYADDIGLMTLY